MKSVVVREEWGNLRENAAFEVLQVSTAPPHAYHLFKVTLLLQGHETGTDVKNVIRYCQQKSHFFCFVKSCDRIKLVRTFQHSFSLCVDWENETGDSSRLDGVHSDFVGLISLTCFVF